MKIRKTLFFIDVKDSNLNPILFNIALQLFAYYYAKSIGTILHPTYLKCVHKKRITGECLKASP